MRAPRTPEAAARRRVQQRATNGRDSRRYYAKLRADALAPYGDSCACCAATEALTLDHIAGGGKQHRQIFTSSSAMYRWIITNGHPDGFQILCSPCNKSKGAGPRCMIDHALHAPPSVARRGEVEQLAAEVRRLTLANARLRMALAQIPAGTADSPASGPAATR